MGEGDIAKDHEDEIGKTAEALQCVADIGFGENERAKSSEDEARDGAASLSLATGDNFAREPIAIMAGSSSRIQGKGKGKGKGGFRNVVVGVQEARAAMDVGLQATLDELPADLRRRMDAFISDRVSGRRVKLPWTLKAKQRKAVHVWAEMHGLEHRSFGYRGKRRLHLIVPGTDAGDVREEEDWEGEEEDWEGED